MYFEVKQLRSLGVDFLLGHQSLTKSYDSDIYVRWLARKKILIFSTIGADMCLIVISNVSFMVVGTALI